MINKSKLINFFILLDKKAKASYHTLNSVDGQLGDGDLGITIMRGIEEIIKNFENFEEDIGKIFLLCAKAFTDASSSSFGTLTAISFLTLGKLFKNRKEIEVSELVEGLKQVLTAISNRGKSNLGDKTVLDSINEIIISIESEPDRNSLAVAHYACEKALKEFKGKPCKIGRARMFADKSKTLDDPGMYALYVLTSTLVSK